MIATSKFSEGRTRISSCIMTGLIFSLIYKTAHDCNNACSFPHKLQSAMNFKRKTAYFTQLMLQITVLWGFKLKAEDDALKAEDDGVSPLPDLPVICNHCLLPPLAHLRGRVGIMTKPDHLGTYMRSKLCSLLCPWQ